MSSEGDRAIAPQKSIIDHLVIPLFTSGGNSDTAPTPNRRG